MLAAAPPLLLLDEPTRGLDYAAKARGWSRSLRELAAEGHAVVLATHDVELVAEVADRVVVLADGEVVADGPTARGRRLLAGVRAAGRQDPRAAALADRRRRCAAALLEAAMTAATAGAPVRHRRPGAAALRARAALPSSRSGVVAFGWPLLAEPGSGLAPRRGTRRWLFAAAAAAAAGASSLAEIADGGMDAKAVAMLGVLAAVGARAAPARRRRPPGSSRCSSCSSSAAGCSAAASASCSARVTMFASALLTGGVGPWLPFQMLAAGWVGLLRRLPAAAPRGRREIACCSRRTRW